MIPRLVFMMLLLSFTASAQNKPNIVFIFSDDHAYQAIGAYGSIINKTPNIDRIAKQGMTFTNSFVTNSICGPSRAVIQTGKHSHINGFRANEDVFDANQQTFPKLLQQSGYQTAMIGKWHLHTDPQGFSYWDILPGQGHYYNPDFVSAKGRQRVEGYVSDIVTDKTLAWLNNSRDESKPFMLMMQHKAPHRPWEPGPKYLNLYKDVVIPEPENLFDDYQTRGSPAKNQNLNIAQSMQLTYDNKVWDLINSPEKMSDWERLHIRKFKGFTYDRMTGEQRSAWDAAYKKENDLFLQNMPKGKALTRWKYQRYVKDYLRTIASVDESVGRVLDYLESSGLAENTIVIYGSDQGFYLGEHGWFDKRFMYEESFKTPLLVKWPGVTNGSHNTNLVQNLDYAQTFLDMAGVTAPNDMQGLSLVPLLKQQDVKWRDSVYYHYYEDPSEHNIPRHEGIRTARYKLIHFYGLEEWELYDLKNDPAEMNNLYSQKNQQTLIVSLKGGLKKLKAEYAVPTSDTSATDVAESFFN